MIPPPPRSTLFPYTTLFRSQPDFRGCAFLNAAAELGSSDPEILATVRRHKQEMSSVLDRLFGGHPVSVGAALTLRSEEHTSELQSHSDLVCRLLLEKKKTTA